MLEYVLLGIFILFVLGLFGFFIRSFSVQGVEKGFEECRKHEDSKQI